MSDVNRQLRSGSKGTNDFYAEIKQLLSSLESRIMQKLDDISSRLSNVEQNHDRIVNEQLRLGVEVQSLKETVHKQQLLIENLDIKSRQCNLIFSGIPEGNVTSNGKTLSDDIEKISEICDSLEINVHSPDITVFNSCYRLGPKKLGSNRALKVSFSDLKHRNKVLYNQKSLREDNSAWYSKVFANKDLPFLTRSEEKRLKERLQLERRAASPQDKIFLKNGKLYRNGDVIDYSNIFNQLN